MKKTAEKELREIAEAPIMVYKSTHRKLKLAAVLRNTTIAEITSSVVNRYLKSPAKQAKSS